MPDITPPVSLSQHKGISIVEFTSSRILDESVIAQIKQSLVGLVESTGTPKLLLDFSNVDHLSSAALGALIDVNNRVRSRNGQLRLTNIATQIYEVFVITKLNKLFRILPTREEGLSSFT